MDESYTLTVNGDTLELTANKQWGAMRGLATVAQAIYATDPASCNGDSSGGCEYALAGAPFTIKDAPRYPWRGLMIDTSRHYLPLPAILRTVDAMSAAKLNVLHWHIVDAESFPAVLPDTFGSGLSALGLNGSYAADARYSVADMNAVLEYATNLGIRVVMEWDNPGHAASWSAAYPDVVTKCPTLAANIANLPLNPSAAMTMELLHALLKASNAMFPDGYIHLGGDEVVQQCWADDPNVVAWMQKQGFTTTDEVYQYFVNATGTEVTSSLGATPV